MTSALAPLETSKYLALQPDNEIAAIIKENLGDIQLSLNDLPRITTPSGGGLLWMIDRGGDPKAEKELVGIVLSHRGHRTYWERKMGEGEQGPPDCSSDDGVTGYARRDPDNEPMLWGETDGCQSCATCPFAKWGSKGSSAIACAKRREMVFLAQGEMFPFIVDLGPTSAVVFESFLRDLSLRGGRLAQTEITLGLKKVKSGGGIEYSILEMRGTRPLSPAEAAAARDYGQAYKRVKAQEAVAA